MTIALASAPRPSRLRPGAMRILRILAYVGESRTPDIRARLPWRQRIFGNEYVTLARLVDDGLVTLRWKGDNSYRGARLPVWSITREGRKAIGQFE